MRAMLIGYSDADIDGAAAVGQPIIVEVCNDGVPVRTLHFVVAELRLDGFRDTRRHWRVHLVHELALLGLRADVRLFQEQRADESWSPRCWRRPAWPRSASRFPSSARR